MNMSSNNKETDNPKVNHTTKTIKEMHSNELLDKAVNTADKQEQAKSYEDYVKQVTPKKNLCMNIIRAFFVGGLICCLGQLLLNLFTSQGMNNENAGMWTNIVLIATSVILTGLGLYSKLGEFAGGGSLVPITGFANSVAASAIEFKKEGQIFGIGCKIFTIAGPVILYGIFASWVLGLIYWILKLVEIV